MAKYTPKKKQNLRRIRRFIKSAERRGYQFKSELKEKLSSFSTQKLKALTPEKLYKQAEYKLDTDITISGERGRQIERALSARKATRTRLINKYGYEEYLRRYEPSAYDYYRQGYDNPYYEEPKEDIQEDEYIPNFTDIVLSNIEALIRQANNSKWNVAVANSYIVDEALEVEISNYGRDKVAYACEQAPEDLIYRVQHALESSTTSQCHDRTMAFMQVIRSYIPTIEESKEITETVENVDDNYMQNDI